MWSLMRAHSCKRQALVATTFSNSEVVAYESELRLCLVQDTTIMNTTTLYHDSIKAGISQRELATTEVH